MKAAHQMNKVFLLLLKVVGIILLSACCCPADMPVIKGVDYNPFIVNSERLYERKVIIQDLMADHKRTFTKSEKKRGFKDYSYAKFVLRDSKLPCFISKHDYKDMERFKEIRKGDRVTLIGRIERIGKGVRRFTNPKFVVKVDDILKGWELSDEEAVLEFIRDEEPIDYRELSPGELSNIAPEHDGKYILIRDKFSMLFTNYTNFEKDLNLSNDTALKFRGELFPIPCYVPRSEENLKLLSGLKSGDKITIYGKICLRQIPDDHLRLLSAHAIKKGWD